MNSYLIAFVSDSHRLMNEPYFYHKVYRITTEEENVKNYEDYLERKFCLEFKVPLANVYHLWTCKIK